MEEGYKMGKITQTQRIIAYIERNGSITAYEAMKELGIVQIHARLSELRKAGVIINSATEKSENRFGDTVRYKRYTIIGNNREQGK